MGGSGGDPDTNAIKVPRAGSGQNQPLSLPSALPTSCPCGLRTEPLGRPIGCLEVAVGPAQAHQAPGGATSAQVGQRMATVGTGGSLHLPGRWKSFVHLEQWTWTSGACLLSWPPPVTTLPADHIPASHQHGGVRWAGWWGASQASLHVLLWSGEGSFLCPL